MLLLGWLQTAPSRLKVFVDNRVWEIIDKVPAGHWRHVATEVNPADSLSRGKVASQHLLDDLWGGLCLLGSASLLWTGPDT